VVHLLFLSVCNFSSISAGIELQVPMPTRSLLTLLLLLFWISTFERQTQKEKLNHQKKCFKGEKFFPMRFLPLYIAREILPSKKKTYCQLNITNVFRQKRKNHKYDVHLK
jgi:hypothetical protein